jgi:RNA polymerase sigma factor (sigma-70 family)
VAEREERFQRMYELTRPRVIAYALRRTITAEDAADVVAETFAITWQRLDVIPEGEWEMPWLYAVARRVIANRERRSSSQSAIVTHLAAELAASYAAIEEVDAERLAALSALYRLSEEDREILMLVAWDGLTSRELARVLGCSPTAARIRLHRARARLNGVWTTAGGSVIASGPSATQPLQEVPEP